MFSTNGRAKCKRVLVSRIFSKNMTDFLNLQTANTRKIKIIQEEIGSETKFNDNNNNNVDWLKDKADGEHFDKNHFQYKTFLCCL